MPQPEDRRALLRQYRRQHPVASRGLFASIGALMGWGLVYRMTVSDTAVNLTVGAIIGACVLLALFEWRTR